MVEQAETPVERTAWVDSEPWPGIQLLRARFSAPVRCPECGKKRKHFWGLTVGFAVMKLGMMVAHPDPEKSYLPNSVICMSHIISPRRPAEDG